LLKQGVEHLLERNGIEATVTGRTKGLYSMFCKMERKGATIEQIMDKIGLRIIVQSVRDCYTVLGLLHTQFRPIPGAFDDYIGLRKENGYQSLHTCVYPLRKTSAKPVELQIRTELMHQNAEFGVAAHWRYKTQEEGSEENDRPLGRLRSISTKCQQLSSEEFVAQLKRQVFEENVVVFSEAGQRMRVAAGSTVSDYIERHNRCLTENVAVINGQPQAADYELQDGDMIELREGHAAV
jgi:GTP pyrophosphokinase